MIKNRFIEMTEGTIAIAESEGPGTPIILIHGNSSCKEVFQNQLESEIGKQYRLIAVDLPGHGQSDDAANPEITNTIPGYAEKIMQLLDILEIDNCVIFGWSLGGHIGIELNSRCPKITALMISGTPPVGKSEDQMAQGFLPSEHMGLSGKEIFSEQDSIDYAHSTCGAQATFKPFLLDAVRRSDGRARAALFAGFANGLGADQREVVETSTIPLAIVNGAQEPFINNEFVCTINYANLWEHQVHILDGVGHAPFWEAPSLFDPIFGRFLESVS